MEEHRNEQIKERECLLTRGRQIEGRERAACFTLCVCVCARARMCDNSGWFDLMATIG